MGGQQNTKMRNYAEEAGTYRGTLLALRFNLDVFNLFDCDASKMEAFQLLIGKINQEIEQTIPA
jgi:hypothetical protein